MASLSYFPLYPKDFLGATGRLNAEKFGIYTRLLFNSWFEPLDNEIEDLAFIAGSNEKLTQQVLDRYFVLEGDCWVNHRLEKERKKATAKHQKAVESGRKGAEKRWGDDSNPNGDPISPPNGNPNSRDVSKTIATHNSKPITHNTEPKTQKERKRFAPPSLEELIELFIEKDSSKIEAEKFFYFYESKNWMVGKNKMKSWRASVGGWIARNKSDAIKEVGYIPQVED